MTVITQGPVPAHLQPATTETKLSPAFQFQQITRTLEGYLGQDIEPRLTARKERTEAATGEPRPPKDQASEEMNGWELTETVSEPRLFAAFSICERKPAKSTGNTRDRKVPAFQKKWWNCKCWNPSAISGLLFSLKQGSKVAVTGYVQTYMWNDEERETFIVTGIRPIKLSTSKRPVPTYDYDPATDSVLVDGRMPH